MPMPSVEDLQTMYGAWNPQAYLQAQDNAGLERQFREQQYSQEQEKAKQASLQTIFDQQNNPLKIKQRELENENLGYTGTGLQADNETKARNNRIAAANETFKINSDKAEMLAKLSKSQLEEGESTAKRLMMSLDPVEQEKGKKLYGLTAHARDLADKREQDMKELQYKELQHTGRQTEMNNTQLEVARIGAQGKKDVAGMKTSIPKPPSTPIAQYLADLRKAYQEGKVDEEVYNRSVANAVNADLQARSGANAVGVTAGATPSGDINIVPKPAAPSVAPVGKGTGDANKTKSGVTYRVVP